jgi:hypothetical protein
MEKKPNIKIFVTHFNKPDYIYEDDIFVPIQAWKKNAKIDLWIQWDDTWDNISEKNPQYAELTTQYWVWKNYDLSDVDYVWFCHYRRYLTFFEKHTLRDIFVPKDFKRSYDNYTFLYALKYICGSLLFLWHTSLLREWAPEMIKRESEILKENLFEYNKNVYVPKTQPLWNLKYPPFKNFWIKNKKLADVIINTFLELYPQYQNWLIRTQRQYSFHKCNIFIMDKASFYEYSERLFNYFFELEKRIVWFDTSNEIIGNRFIGCLWEFMVDFWLNCIKGEKTVKSLNLIHFNV